MAALLARLLLFIRMWSGSAEYENIDCSSIGIQQFYVLYSKDDFFSHIINLFIKSNLDFLPETLFLIAYTCIVTFANIAGTVALHLFHRPTRKLPLPSKWTLNRDQSDDISNDPQYFYFCPSLCNFNYYAERSRTHITVLTWQPLLTVIWSFSREMNTIKAL